MPDLCLTYSILACLLSGHPPPQLHASINLHPTQASVSMHTKLNERPQGLEELCGFCFPCLFLDWKRNMGSSPTPRGRGALLLPLPLLCFFFLSGAPQCAESARVFTIINKCKTTIWPAASPGGSFGGGGFALRPGQSMVFTAPVGWSGRIWGRTDCNFDASGNGSCATGSCGTTLKCGASGATPASLAEFTLASLDYYDVSLVDGFNLPVLVKPVNGEGNCTAAGCDGDLRQSCPSELAVKVNGQTVACRSACDVFDTDQYCCRGQYGNPVTCQPTFYSKKFKAVCPTAYSYAYDDPTSIFTCKNADYIITFCSTSKQPVCSYHNNRLICSDSSRSWPIMSTATLMFVLLFSLLALQF